MEELIAISTIKGNIPKLKTIYLDEIMENYKKIISELDATTDYKIYIPEVMYNDEKINYIASFFIGEIVYGECYIVKEYDNALYSVDESDLNYIKMILLNSTEGDE